MPLIWRGVGLLVMMNGFVATTFAAKGQPYLVSALPPAGPAFILAPAAYYLYIILWLATAVCGLPMLLGSRLKFWPLLAVIGMCILGAMEYTSLQPTYEPLTIIFLFALLFDRKGPSPTARIMQITTSFVYVMSVAHKIHPEWLGGYTVYQLFNSGHLTWPFLNPFLQSLHVTLPVAQVIAILTLFGEFGLAVSFWFEKTRKWGLIIGVLFHIGLTSFLSWIFQFIVTMMVGYLSFLGNKRATTPVNAPVRTGLAIAFIVLTLVIPNRMFVLDKPIMQFSFGDWVPWTMAMYIYDEEVKQVAIQYKDSDGQWRVEPPTKRMTWAGSDKDLHALLQYLLNEHKDAVEAKVTSDLLINGHWRMVKECTAVREPNGLKFALQQQTVSQ
jgi:hypothetical protein